MLGIDSTHRRGFLARLAAGAAAVAATPALTAASPGRAQAGNPDRWIDGLTGRHKQLFDMPEILAGLPLIHIFNYFGTYASAYGAKPGEVNAVGTYYGVTTLFGVNDAMWAKYRVGQALSFNDHKTSQPAVRNVWRTDPEIQVGSLKMVMPAASTEALQKAGTTFILCNNALTFFAGMLASATNQQQAAVMDELKANMLPGVVLVPAMVIAIEKAQGRGIAYNRQ